MDISKDVFVPSEQIGYRGKLFSPDVYTVHSNDDIVLRERIICKNLQTAHTLSDTHSRYEAGHFGEALFSARAVTKAQCPDPHADLYLSNVHEQACETKATLYLFSSRY